MLSVKEKAILLLLFKDFSVSYNARSISGKVGMTPRGALKALKNLEKQGFVSPKPFGRAIEYMFSFSNALAKKNVELFLLEEAELKHKRWVEEFRKFGEARILVLFGSASRMEKGYNDIDILAVVDKNKYQGLLKKIEEKSLILPKKIHPVVQTLNDLKENLRARNAVVLDAIRTGVVVRGADELVEVVESVTGS